MDRRNIRNVSIFHAIEQTKCFHFDIASGREEIKKFLSLLQSHGYRRSRRETFLPVSFSRLKQKRVSRWSSPCYTRTTRTKTSSNGKNTPRRSSNFRSLLSMALSRRQPTSIWPFVLSACEGTIIFYYSHLRFIIEVFLLFMSIKNGRRWYTQMNFLFLEWKLMLVSFEKDETKVFVLLKNELKFFHHNDSLFTTTKLFLFCKLQTPWIQERFTSKLAPQGPEFWVTVRQIMRSFLIVPDRCLFFSSCSSGLRKWTLARMDRTRRWTWTLSAKHSLGAAIFPKV